MTHTVFSAAAAALFRCAGRDLFIERAGPAWAFLDFDRVNHGEGEHEAWGLGLHIVVSPLPVAA
jgi:hypothetical protein